MNMNKDPKQHDELGFNRSLLLNHLMQQPLSTQGPLTSRMPFTANSSSSNSLLAAAVQQQLVASLATPSMSLLQPLQQLTAQRSLSGSGRTLLSRHDHGVLLRDFPSTSKSNLIPLQGGHQIELDTENDLKTPQEPTTQIPCQARGMSADHNSLVSLSIARLDTRLRCSKKGFVLTC